MPPEKIEKNDILIDTVTKLQNELAQLKSRLDMLEAAYTSLNKNYNGHIHGLHINQN
jgi:hypothetical protein